MTDWRPVDGWPHYEVSESGAVRSLPRVVRCGNHLTTTRERLLVQSLDKAGRCVVTLSHENKKKNFCVHRLVAFAFLGAPPNAIVEIAHYDGDPRNNNIRNLRWATALENAEDRDRHGRTARGEKVGTSRLDEITVHAIRGASGAVRAVARQFGVSRAHVKRIRSGTTWAHLS